MVAGKFRTALDQSLDLGAHSIHDHIESGHVFLGYSGGASSTVLLDLIFREYLSPAVSLSSGKRRLGTQKPMSKRERTWKKAYVGYVETSAAYPGVSCHIILGSNSVAYLKLI